MHRGPLLHGKDRQRAVDGEPYGELSGWWPTTTWYASAGAPMFGLPVYWELTPPPEPEPQSKG